MNLDAKPVTKGDVVPYAKKSCKTCYGTGLYVHSRGPGTARVERLCNCGLRAFMRTGLAAVEPTTGQLKFKPLTLDTLAELSSDEPSTPQLETLKEKVEPC